jgi:hypothetical protein
VDATRRPLHFRFKELRTLTIVGCSFFLASVTTTATLLWACMTMDPGIVMPAYAKSLLQRGHAEPQLFSTPGQPARPSVEVGDVELSKAEVVSKRLDMGRLSDGPALAALNALGGDATPPAKHEWQSHPLDDGGGWGATMLARRGSSSKQRVEAVGVDEDDTTAPASTAAWPSPPPARRYAHVDFATFCIAYPSEHRV